MGYTLIENIIREHCDDPNIDVRPGALVDLLIDWRVARDFGGANVAKNIEDNGLSIDDPKKTFFTFDCNPTGSDKQYAQNQHKCRVFASERGLRVYDIDYGIGTHVAFEEGKIKPGHTFVSTDSHANIMGAIGAFGQGMGDIDIAAAWANGKVWFKVPKSMKIVLKGTPSGTALPKDVCLKMASILGADGLLGYSAEVYGEYAEKLDLAGRITISSMATEMGAISILFTPNKKLLQELKCPKGFKYPIADEDAHYDKTLEIDISDIGAFVALPGHPDFGRDAVGEGIVAEKRRVTSGFIGSCTNGRYEDFVQAANVLRGKRVAPGICLICVPATRRVYEQLAKNKLLEVFIESGCLVSNPGCAGCANGQLAASSQKGETVVSTGNRNYPGKQGAGDMYLASPATVAASCVAGFVCTAETLPTTALDWSEFDFANRVVSLKKQKAVHKAVKPTVFSGKAWVVPVDSIDTDMIFHNKWLTITKLEEMGQHAFGNLPGYENFPKEVKLGDVLFVGKNFGCGSSRQQAVDCFKALGVSAIIADSFGAIYERNAINNAMPIMTPHQLVNIKEHVKHGDEIEIDLKSGTVKNLSTGNEVPCVPFSKVQYDIYMKDGLLGGDW